MNVLLWIYINVGMDNLGVTSFERNPPGTEEDKIALDTFVSEA